MKLLKRTNEPVIFFGIHSGNWEICVPILDKYGFNVGAIYRHINNNFFDNYIFKKRTNALKTKKVFTLQKEKKVQKKF